MKNFIITGGNFNNKGAQAMVYITAYELRKRYPSCSIVMMDVVCPEKKITTNNLKFDRYNDGWIRRLYFSSGRVGKIVVKIIARHKINLNSIKKYEEALKKADAILDVSGYAIGSNWSFKSNISYILMLKMANKYKIPIFLLPQSFGPFDYHGIKGTLIDFLLYRYLKIPKLIFAREKDGYKLLKEHYGVDNIQLAEDIVLQNRNIDFSLILKDVNDIYYNIHKYKDKGVGIIPSVNNFRYDNKDEIWKIYFDTIDFILNKDEIVYLAAHSGEDLKICQKLKQQYKDNPKVCLIEKELSFIEFEALTENFKFMIASRFHSIVLGYKKFTPSIILGWAVKYCELAEEISQGEYVLKTDSLESADILIQVVNKMYINYEKERQVLKSYIGMMQDHNCFDIISKMI